MLGIAIPLVFILAVMGIFLVVKGRRRGPHREVFVDVSGMVFIGVSESVEIMMSQVLFLLWMSISKKILWVVIIVSKIFFSKKNCYEDFFGIGVRVKSNRKRRGR